MIGNQPTFKYVFLGMDFVILTISFFLSLKITISDFRTISEQHFYLSFGFLFLLYLFVLTTYLFSFLFNNLYKRDVVLYRYRQLVLIVKSLLVGSVITILFMIVFNMDYFTLHGKKLILYFSLCSFALFFLVFKRVRSFLKYFEDFKIQRFGPAGASSGTITCGGVSTTPDISYL